MGWDLLFHPLNPLPSFPPPSSSGSFARALSSRARGKSTSLTAPSLAPFYPLLDGLSNSNINNHKLRSKLPFHDNNNNSLSPSLFPFSSGPRNHSTHNFSPPPPVISPNGRLPSLSGNGIALGSASYNAPSSPHSAQLPNFNPELLSQFSHIIQLLLERFSPILKLLDIYDSLSGFLSSFLCSLISSPSVLNDSSVNPNSR